MLRKNLFVLIVANFAAISLPAYLIGCGSSNSGVSANAITASNGSGGSSSATPGSGTSGGGSSDGGTSGAGTSGSGSSSSGGSGSSASGSSGSGSSSSGSSSSGSSSSGSSSGGSSDGGGSSSGSSASNGGSGSSSSADQIPAGALAVKAIQKLSNWDDTFDKASGGHSSSGEMSLTGSPSRSGSARQFVTHFSRDGGERYSVSFGADAVTTNYFYDGWVYIAKPAGEIANLELDINQVMENGQTVIYGFQCDGYNSTWDYSKNAGTPEKPNGEWVHSKEACNPRKWSANTWHHVQIAYSRTKTGKVTYKSVWLDGKEQTLNITAPSAYALGWGGNLVTNFQVDGHGASGKATVYLDDLTIYRW